MAAASSLRLRLALAALAVILPVTAQFEGRPLAAYADPGVGWGLPTICYGHTRGVHRGDTATPAQCEAWLVEDMTAAVAVVQTLVHVTLSPDELAAYGDFVFNAGPGKFAGSTMLRKLNAGDHAGACAELSRWVYAGGKQMPGLVNRRATVRTICERP